MFKKIAIVVGLMSVCLFGAMEADAWQMFAIDQPVTGEAGNDWSFMTAWNLSTGEFEVSTPWYNGYHTMWYNLDSWNEWVALFVYDDGLGETRELMWSYVQYHVQ